MRQWEVQIISLSNANTQSEGEKRREGEGVRGVEGVGYWRGWGRLLTTALFLDPVILSFRFQKGLGRKKRKKKNTPQNHYFFFSSSLFRMQTNRKVES